MKTKIIKLGDGCNLTVTIIDRQGMPLKLATLKSLVISLVSYRSQNLSFVANGDNTLTIPLTYASNLTKTGMYNIRAMGELFDGQAFDYTEQIIEVKDLPESTETTFVTSLVLRDVHNIAEKELPDVNYKELGYEVFSPFKAYAKDSVVLFGDTLYKFTSAKAAGIWNASKVKATSVALGAGSIYENIINKPKINGNTVEGNKTGESLGLVDKTYSDRYLAQKNGVYPDMYVGGIASWRGETYTDQHSVTGIANKTEEGRTNLAAIVQATNEPMTEVQAIIVTGPNVMNSAHKVEDTPFMAFPVPKLTYGEGQNNGVLFNNDYGEEAFVEVVLFSAQYPTSKNAEDWIELREVNDVTEGNTNGGYYENDGRRHYLTPSTGWLIVDEDIFYKDCAILGTWSKPNVFEPVLDWHKGKFYIDLESTQKHIEKVLASSGQEGVVSMVFLSANSAGTAKNTVTLAEKYMTIAIKCGVLSDYKYKEWHSESTGGGNWTHYMKIRHAKANGSARLSDGTALNVDSHGTVSYSDQNEVGTDLPIIYELEESVEVKVSYIDTDVFSESFDMTFADDGNSLIALVNAKSGLTLTFQKTGLMEDGVVDVVNNRVPALEQGKADKTAVVSNPTGSMLPNMLYNFGELSSNTTFTLAAATDNTVMNVWRWKFSTGNTVPTITLPSGLAWEYGEEPVFEPNQTYLIVVTEGIAVCISTAGVKRLINGILFGLQNGLPSLRVEELTIARKLDAYIKEGNALTSGAGAPTILPQYNGQEYFDTTNKVWYKASYTGTEPTASAWKQITN